MSLTSRIGCSLLIAVCATASMAGESEDPKKLTVERIFGKNEFEADHKTVKWLPEGSGYLTLELSSDPAGGRDLVLHDPASGKQEVLVPAAHLIPPKEVAPLAIDEYALTPDRCRLLVL